MDVGKKRVGLAVSDELGLTAQGLETLVRKRIREDIQTLTGLIHKWNVQSLLIGKPLHMSGEESRQGEYTREFAGRIVAATGLPVVYWDERLTSVEAERLLRQSGATWDRREGTVDRIAAVLMLESYLDFRRHQERDAEEESRIE